MYRIYLQNFRCWSELDLNLADQGVTLCKGASGCGKSSLFQAIAWCLYGKIRMVAPNQGTGKTRVILYCTTATIERRKQPNRLLVTTAQQQLEDQAAQAYINSWLGSYEVWLAASYVAQGQHNHFLRLSDGEKMELLNQIAFQEEDPAHFFTRIDQQLQQLNVYYQQATLRVQQAEQHYQQLGQRIDPNWALSPEQSQQLQADSRRLAEQVNHYQQQLSQRQIQLALLAAHRQEQANLLLPQAPPPPPSLRSLAIHYGHDLHDLPTLQNTLTQLATLLPLLKRRSELRQQQQSLRQQLSTSGETGQPVTLDDWQAAVTQETTLAANQGKAARLGISYQAEALQQLREQLQQTLAAQPYLAKAGQVHQLTKELATLTHKLTKLTTVSEDEEEIVAPTLTDCGKLREQLNQYLQEKGGLQVQLTAQQRAADVLTCPHCQGLVRYREGTLLVATEQPLSPRELLATREQLKLVGEQAGKLIQEIATHEEENKRREEDYRRTLLRNQQRQQAAREHNRRVTQERKLLTQQIDQLTEELATQRAALTQLAPPAGDEHLLTPAEQAIIRQRLVWLEEITILTPPQPDSKTIRRLLAQQQLVSKLAELQAEEASYSIPEQYQAAAEVANYHQQLTTYTEALTKYQLAVDYYHKRQQELATTMAQVETSLPADCTGELLTSQQTISYYSRLLQQAEQAQQLALAAQAVQQAKQQANLLNQQLANLYRLRQHAVDAECQVLQELVEQINATLAGAVSVLFDDNLQVRLNLYRTLKTTGQSKPQVNLAIAGYENVQQLSGGEGDRVSLALTLAFHRLNHYPFLLLDESLASLDSLLKETAVQAIRQHSAAQVLVIAHDSVEGIYQQVIDLEQLRDRN